MKKVLLLAAFGVAGMMSATNCVNLKDARTKISSQNIEKLEMNPPAIVWIQITAPCGAVYYLNANDYSSPEQFMSDYYYFNGAKCNGDTGSGIEYPYT